MGLVVLLSGLLVSSSSAPPFSALRGTYSDGLIRPQRLYWVGLDDGVEWGKGCPNWGVSICESSVFLIEICLVFFVSFAEVFSLECNWEKGAFEFDFDLTFLKKYRVYFWVMNWGNSYALLWYLFMKYCHWVNMCGECGNLGICMCDIGLL